MRIRQLATLVCLMTVPAAVADTTGVRCTFRSYSDPIPALAGLGNLTAEGPVLYATRSTPPELIIFNVADPEIPAVVATVALPDTPRSVVPSGALLYVGTETSVEIIDVSSPGSPAPTGSIAVPDDATGLAVRGDTVLVVDHSDALLVIDASDPSAPVLSGEYDSPRLSQRAVAIKNDVAFIVETPTEVLAAVSFANPASPTLLYTIPSASSPTCFAVHGDQLYVGMPGGTINVYDISNPAIAPGAPAEIAIPERANAFSFKFVADTMYVSARDAGLVLMDVSDPSSITTTARYNTFPATTICPLDSAQMYLFTPFGVVSFDATTPAGSTIAQVVADPEQYRFASRVGDTLFAAQWTGTPHLLSFDISDPASPVLLDALPLSIGISSLIAHGDFVYLGGGSTDQSVYVFDASDPANLTEVGLATVSGDVPRDLAISGTRLYASTGLSIQSFDISTPGSPVPGATAFPSGPSIDASARTLGLDVVGTTVFVMYENANSPGGGGIAAFDFSNPLAPVQLGYTFDLTAVGRDIVVDGDTAFLADSKASVYEVSDPTDMYSVGSTSPTTIGGAYDLALADGFAFIASTRGVAIFDVRDPSSPTLAGNFSTDFGIHTIEVNDGVVFATAFEGGLLVIDVADCAQGCIADLDGNNLLNVDDIDLFTGFFLAGDLSVDFDGNGSLNVDDVDAFISSFASGCP